MYFVYVLFSERDKKFYIGYTTNLKQRLRQHLNGEVISTKYRRELRLIYFEVYLDRDDAKGRELFLKGGSGHVYLRKQLRNYLKGKI